MPSSSLSLPLRRLSTRRAFSSSSAVHGGLCYKGRSYPYVWLRDSCQCSSCLHPSTLQKLHKTSDIPQDIKPAQDGVHFVRDGVSVTWNTGHGSYYPGEFLDRYRNQRSIRAFHHDVDHVGWDVERLKSSPTLFLPYDALELGTQGLYSAITQLARYGLLFISSVSNERTSNADCEIRALGELFGELRNTFYGETWDVKNIKDSRNIAYTNVDLGLHMDLLYFQHPPRYQILHCLRNRVEGGTSIFVDAIHVASKLRAQDPAAFNVLASTPVAFHYVNDGHHLHHSHPTIQLSRWPSPLTGEHEIEFVNYSPPFQAPLALGTPSSFYPAFAQFAEMLADPAVRFEYLLKEGDAVLFDNRRVLHARTEFREREAESNDAETNRWLKGCYLEADAVLDKGRMLRAQIKEQERDRLEQSARSLLNSRTVWRQTASGLAT